MKVRFASLRREQSGFTLIELMVVVAIIALLTTIAVPWLSSAIRKAKGGVGATDLYSFAGAMERGALEDASNNYVSDLKTLQNTGYLRSGTTFLNRFGRNYILITQGVAGTPPTSSSTRTWYVIADPGNTASGSNVVVKCNTEIGLDSTSSPAWASGNIAVTSTSGTPATAFVVAAPTATQTKCWVERGTSGADANADLATTNVVRNWN